MSSTQIFVGDLSIKGLCCLSTLARARRMGMADLFNACSDWSTIGLVFARCRRRFLMSATNVGNSEQAVTPTSYASSLRTIRHERILTDRNVRVEWILSHELIADGTLQNPEHLSTVTALHVRDDSARRVPVSVDLCGPRRPSD